MRVESRESRVQSQRQGRIGRRNRPASPALDSRLSTLDRPHSGFTLTELLVVMLIMIILVVMTVAAVNFGFAAERSRSAARQVQSYLEGARDRAIYERHPVGVRFLLDDSVTGTSTSMVFVEELDPPYASPVQVLRRNTIWVARQRNNVLPPTWADLRSRGSLTVGVRIKIPDDDDGFWYTVQGFPSNNEIRFEPDFRPGSNGSYSHRLQLPPVIRPNQEPMLLPRGIAIDLARSQLPRSWANGPLDVMFSPRGTVTGKAAASGLIHFYLAETADIERLNADQNPALPNVQPFRGIPADVPVGISAEPVGDRVIVTLFPQTGAISAHPVDVTDQFNNSTGDAGADRKADDPFFFAETGEVAGK